MKIMVGMSGGVDSSAAALLLQQQGFEIAGGTLRLMDAGADAADAAAVCGSLGIAHYVFDLREQFREQVIDYFAHEYDRGRTPNPCAVCNRAIKFGAFLEKAVELGFDRVATGHYARVAYDRASGRFRLMRAVSAKKDQSYVLYGLSQEQLGAAVFPLGGYEKPEVRQLVGKYGLATSRKSDSQDACFIPDGDYAGFLDGYLGGPGIPGDFVDTKGNRLGRHKGIRRYTIGQRKGLGISFERPMFVSEIDAARNTVTLDAGDALMKSRFTVSRINWIAFGELVAPVRLQVRIRYSARLADALVTPLGKSAAEVVFDEPQRAVTPGQPAVFYDGEYVAGGGVIF